MKIVVLHWISRIAIFQICELGNLFEFTLVPVVDQKNIVAMIGRQHCIPGGCCARGPVGGLNDTRFTGESDKTGIQVIVNIVCDLCGL